MNNLKVWVSLFRHRFLRRFKNRLKVLLRFDEMWNWECESCENCGNCFRIGYDVKDEVWKGLYGSEGGCLCLDCAIKAGLEKGITIKPKDFKTLYLFYYDDPSYDIIKET